MPNQKKGFVMYFDSLGLLNLFPPDQIGELLLALYDYACCICDTEETPEAALSRYPQLDAATQVGFCSMAGHILRDTRKWKQRQSNCQQSALERHRRTQPAGTSGTQETPPSRQESSPYEGRPYEGRPYEGRPYEGRPYEGRPYEKRPYEKHSYEKRPYESRSYGNRPQNADSTDEEMAAYVREFMARKRAEGKAPPRRDPSSSD